jgi:prepilin-type N-terminal cleavage/methylation domain-containing protein
MHAKILTRRFRGVSLTELVVVMAIILILLSLLLVTIAKAVQAAHKLAG